MGNIWSWSLRKCALQFTQFLLEWHFSGGDLGLKAIFFIFEPINFIFGMWMCHMIVFSNMQADLKCYLQNKGSYHIKEQNWVISYKLFLLMPNHKYFFKFHNLAVRCP